MEKIRFGGFKVWLFLAAALVSSAEAYAQAGFEDGRVMLQGFYWESHRHGDPERFPEFGEKRWYEIVRAQADWIRAGRFDLLWLPPPSYAGEKSAGYNPAVSRLKEDLSDRPEKDPDPGAPSKQQGYPRNVTRGFIPFNRPAEAGSSIHRLLRFYIRNKVCVFLNHHHRNLLTWIFLLVGVL
ncbi:hypothetical protein [Nitrosococcus wardiae]|uniref:hypothetical protein n=1 Tax=Nitrosococcus wardiae TaxID=1814290 RepID=UPI001F0CF3B9|nr:hypothetical protein [Nitrosococcus wardiae]